MNRLELFKKYESYRKHLNKCFHESNLIENINDERADLNMQLAWAYLIGYSSLSEPIIKHTHSMITSDQEGFDDRDKGQYRQELVEVGGRICPRPYVMLELMHNWILDMQDYQNQDPKKMHIRFEKIHPFLDGNGRTGRMLMWWHEVNLGKEPTLIESAKRQEYYKWFG